MVNVGWRTVSSTQNGVLCGAASPKGPAPVLGPSLIATKALSRVSPHLLLRTACASPSTLRKIS